MEITVNGESKFIADNPLAITDILTIFDVEMPDMVSVQLNGEFVERKNFTNTIVKSGDEIEFLYFMGGGQSSYHRWKRWLDLYGWKPCKAKSHTCGFARHCAPRVEPGVSLYKTAGS